VHCHILDHEDYDMLRPFEVVPNTNTKSANNAHPQKLTPRCGGSLLPRLLQLSSELQAQIWDRCHRRGKKTAFFSMGSFCRIRITFQIVAAEQGVLLSDFMDCRALGMSPFDVILCIHQRK